MSKEAGRRRAGHRYQQRQGETLAHSCRSRSRTPGPIPFWSMNSTPAASRAARHMAGVIAFMGRWLRSSGAARLGAQASPGAAAVPLPPSPPTRRGKWSMLPITKLAPPRSSPEIHLNAALATSTPYPSRCRHVRHILRPSARIFWGCSRVYALSERLFEKRCVCHAGLCPAPRQGIVIPFTP